MMMPPGAIHTSIFIFLIFVVGEMKEVQIASNITEHQKVHIHEGEYEQRKGEGEGDAKDEGRETQRNPVVMYMCQHKPS